MKNENLTTKIIAGKFKGKSITLPPIEITRSSKSILRESLFNTLQFKVIDCNFVEVFGGSGSIGIEAISRGAKEAYFIEKSDESFKVLNENLKSLNIENSITIFGDSFKEIETIKETLKEKKERAYFYIDPPFSIREGMENIYQKAIDMIENLDTDIIEEVIVEHMTKFDFPKSFKNGLELKKYKKFGKSSLSYYTTQDREENV